MIHPHAVATMRACTAGMMEGCIGGGGALDATSSAECAGGAIVDGATGGGALLIGRCGTGGGGMLLISEGGGMNVDGGPEYAGGRLEVGRVGAPSITAVLSETGMRSSRSSVLTSSFSLSGGGRRRTPLSASGSTKPQGIVCSSRSP